MTILSEEIPFTNEAINLYIAETEKRMKYLKQFVTEYDKLKRRLTIAKERLKQHAGNISQLL